MRTYTVQVMVDGHRAGGSKAATQAELWGLIRTPECTDHIAECDTKCDAFTFMSDLGRSGKAIMVDHHEIMGEKSVSVFYAYINRQ